MKYLSPEQILDQDDLPCEDFYVPEWNGSVRLKTLTGAERDEFEASMIIQKGNKQSVNMKNLRAKLVSLCIVDENGNRLFRGDAITKLGMKSSRALDRINEKCQEMNGLSDKDVEELTEGFGEGPSEGTTSD